MKGLFLKDFYNVRGLLLYYLALAAVFGVVSVAVKNIYYFCGYMAFFSVGLTSAVFSYDERDCWERFAITAGIAKKKLVLSRYLFALCNVAVGLILGLIAAAAMGTKTPSEFFFVVLFSFGGAMGTSVMMPCFYRLGVEKSRVIYIVAFAFVFAATFLSVWLSETFVFGKGTALWLTALMLVLTASALAASYFLSLRVCRKKEWN